MIPAVTYKDQYGDLIGESIEQFFYKLIYEPVLIVIAQYLKRSVKLSAADTPLFRLKQKIESGIILYDGQFMSGVFDSQTSKALKALGAVWDTAKRSWKIAPEKLPPTLKSAVSASKDRLEKANKAMQQELDNIQARVDEAVEGIDLSKPLAKVMQDLQRQTIKAMDVIGVEYTLTPEQQQHLSENYINSMKLQIKTWAPEHVVKLREDVQKNAMAGYRYSELMETLEHDYGQTKAKAAFLARQETSLFMAKFRRERFEDAGVKFYRWDTVGDGKVRPDHKKLNDRIFQFGDPPVTDTSTGRRGEPGEDYNCRCIARALTQHCQKIGGEWRIMN
jgi:SPP1 gp7 family putative phage head morphogenesis protein